MGQIARVTGWAIRTLLADLKARGALALDQEPVTQSRRARR